MSIVTATYTLDADRRCVERFTDHVGQTYKQFYFAPASWGATELQAHLDDMKAQVEVRLAEGEAMQVIGSG